jgi:catechol 2,3-dioxygenase-like lactoylglutathione lyase family enzyme
MMATTDGMVAHMARLHHVNLGIPVGGTDAEAGFLVDLLGYKRVEPPAALAAVAKWFEYEDGTQIHLSEDPEHRPAARAHVAVELGEQLSALEKVFDQAGYAYTSLDSQNMRIVFCEDPAGNRWELRGPQRQSV